MKQTIISVICFNFLFFELLNHVYLAIFIFISLILRIQICKISLNHVYLAIFIFISIISRIQICKNSYYVGDILGRNPNVSFLLQFLCMFLPGRHQSGPNIKKLFEPHLTWLLSWQGASAGWREGSVRQQPSLLFCQNSPNVALGRSSDNIELVDFGSRGCK